MTDNIDEPGLLVGRIVLTYWLADDGEAIVTTETPDTDDVPMIAQLGMLKLAEHTIMHPDESDDR